MHRYARGLFAHGMLLIAVAACSPAAVSAQPGAAYYVADMSEAPAGARLSSVMELRPDGQFLWRFNQGDLALSARGEWQSEGGMIRLSNPDQVGQPALEVAASARDPAVAFRVSLDPATRAMASVLVLQLEFPDNMVTDIPMAGGEVALPAGQPRPIAVRLTGDAVSFYTAFVSIAADGDNVLTLRLVPADLGQAFFASQQTQFDGQGMTLDWRGMALRYRRSERRPAGF